MTTPLIIFCFNRPDRLRRVLDAVKNQIIKPDMIIGYSDGPRHDTDILLVKACRKELRDVGAEVVENASNYGCAANIISGTLDAARRFDSFVVLEDDTLPARHWYGAMCLLLDRYGDDPLAGAVGGYPSILAKSLQGHPDVLMSPRFSCWGWGSWKHKWIRVCEEWAHYRSHGQPPWNPLELPGHGGDDIGQMITTHPRGELWDGLVAGSFLHHGLAHVVTKHYLINNIGADLHLSATKLAFMAANNIIEDKLPTIFPPSSSLDVEVSNAIKAYVAAMGQ